MPFFEWIFGKSYTLPSIALPTAEQTYRLAHNNEHGFRARLRLSEIGLIDTISPLKHLSPSKLNLVILRWGHIRTWNPFTGKLGDDLKSGCWDSGVPIHAMKQLPVAYSLDGEKCAIADENKRISYWTFYNDDTTPTYGGSWNTVKMPNIMYWLAENLLLFGRDSTTKLNLLDRRSRSHEVELQNDFENKSNSFDVWTGDVKLSPDESVITLPNNDKDFNNFKRVPLSVLPNGDILSATGKNIILRNSLGVFSKQIFLTQEVVTAFATIDDDLIIYGTQNGTLSLLNLRTKAHDIILKDVYEIPTTAVTVLTNGLVAKGCVGGYITTWDPLSRKVIHNFRAHEGKISCLVALPENKLLSGDGAKICVWE